jgi:transmembrane 9 superfamily protein 2/4
MAPLGSVAVVLSALASCSNAFYLPGFAPVEYNEGVSVEMKVNKLTSVKTQLPYRYYVLPYCTPKDGIKEMQENLGETLTGDQIENSPYEIQVLINKSCDTLCTQKLSAEQKDKFRSMIEDEYLVNWIVDQLPAATRYKRPDGEYMYTDGFLVGLLQNGRYYVHNHVTLDLQFHANPDLYVGYRIVGFEVEPRSAAPKDGQAPCKTPGATPVAFDLDAHDEIIYSYDVSWTWSDVRWASRWDTYLKMTGGQIHWFAILNSVLILIFLSGMVAMILLRTLHRDITKYNEVATAEEQKEETGWKLVHGDVFRRPYCSTLLAVSIGSGMQVLGMSVVTLICALLGLLSPAHRGGLLQSMMVLFTLMGVVAGYTSSRFCKVFEGDEGRWKTTTFMTAFLYPGLMFTIFFVLNLLIWGQKSSGAVPFTTMFALLVLWFGVSVPLVFFGAYAGFKRPVIELPVRTNPIPRRVPEQPWYSKPLFTSLVGGILPFGAVFTELFFIMSSLWLHQFYYLFGFLALVLVIVIVTCAEISIALTYFQLSAEDYNWWWMSFFASGSSAVYVFLYSILYFTSRLQIEKVVSIMLYFGYMFIMSMLFFILTGSIGTTASFYFVRAIYGSIKID